MITPATVGQIKQLNRLSDDAVSQALDEFNLDKVGAQRVLENGDKFMESIRHATKASLKVLSTYDKSKNLVDVDMGNFEGEEVYSFECNYSSGYIKPESVSEQLNSLRKNFPDIEPEDFSFDEAVDLSKLPEGAEGWFVIPKWEMFGDTYFDAVKRVLISRPCNYREYQIINGLHRSAKAIVLLEMIERQQVGHKMRLVPAQLGINHLGRSVRRAEKMFTENEFGLGVYEMSIILRTHPNRLQQYIDLNINLHDEFFDFPDDELPSSPFLTFHAGRICLGATQVNHFSVYHGSATGFVPR